MSPELSILSLSRLRNFTLGAKIVIFLIRVTLVLRTADSSNKCNNYGESSKKHSNGVPNPSFFPGLWFSLFCIKRPLHGNWRAKVSF